MKISDIVDMLERRLTRQESLRSSYSSLGDIEQIERVDEEIAETQASLSLLRTLPE